MDEPNTKEKLSITNSHVYVTLTKNIFKFVTASFVPVLASAWNQEIDAVVIGELRFVSEHSPERWEAVWKAGGSRSQKGNAWAL